MTPRRLPGGGFLLGHFVDGLELSWEPPQHKRYGTEPTDALDATLAALRESARGEPARFAPTLWPFGSGDDAEAVVVQPHGLRSAPYQLECASWVLGVNRDGKPGPRAFVQLRAPYLAAVGPVSAFENVRTWMEGHLLPLVGRMPSGLAPVWRVSRIDLAADVAGVRLSGHDLSRFTTRARGRRAYDEPAVSDHSGRVFTGFRFGRRGAAVFARVYRKDVEAGADSWVRDRWRSVGYDPIQHGRQVWRVEFEIRGSLVRELQVGGEWLPREPEQLLALHLGSLWRYATEKWLVLHTSDETHTRLERSPVTPWWQDLSALSSFAEAPLLDPAFSRAVPPSEDAVRLLQVAVGALTSFGALTGATSWRANRKLLDGYIADRLGLTEFENRAKAKRARRQALTAPSDAPPVTLVALLGQQDADSSNFNDDVVEVGIARSRNAAELAPSGHIGTS